MPLWTQNNRAHNWTWKILLCLDLLARRTSFDAAGARSMDSLRHWVIGESSSNRSTKARLLAAQFDALCVLVLKAKYESSANGASVAAKRAIADILLDGAKSVQQLGNKADELYRFVNEVSP
jgi:hypothetical protein